MLEQVFGDGMYLADFLTSRTSVLTLGFGKIRAITTSNRVYISIIYITIIGYIYIYIYVYIYIYIYIYIYTYICI